MFDWSNCTILALQVKSAIKLMPISKVPLGKNLIYKPCTLSGGEEGWRKEAHRV